MVVSKVVGWTEYMVVEIQKVVADKLADLAADGNVQLRADYQLW